jgi:hypothetical protein
MGKPEAIVVGPSWKVAMMASQLFTFILMLPLLIIIAIDRFRYRAELHRGAIVELFGVICSVAILPLLHYWIDRHHRWEIDDAGVRVIRRNHVVGDYPWPTIRAIDIRLFGVRLYTTSSRGCTRIYWAERAMTAQLKAIYEKETGKPRASASFCRGMPSDARIREGISMTDSRDNNGAGVLDRVRRANTRYEVDMGKPEVMVIRPSWEVAVMLSKRVAFLFMLSLLIPIAIDRFLYRPGAHRGAIVALLGAFCCIAILPLLGYWIDRHDGWEIDAAGVRVIRRNHVLGDYPWPTIRAIDIQLLGVRLYTTSSRGCTRLYWAERAMTAQLKAIYEKEKRR